MLMFVAYTKFLRMGKLGKFKIVNPKHDNQTSIDWSTLSVLTL